MFGGNKCARNAFVAALIVAVFLAITSSFNVYSIIGIVIISTVVYYVCYYSSSDKKSAVSDKG
ncbi:hypothetical protein [Shouchella patagoniensis]|uniref:hypothetical protein n=1 Tax=Shouchella patagoniensis TaxID=228576 RepID=UPI000994E3E4|nr:hypothetical protein [Shouchella patagoniensis]